jgi:ParB family transcriptional regulator, chromosome partitioning protein
MASKKPHKALGRGLSALLPKNDAKKRKSPSKPVIPTDDNEEKMIFVNIKSVEPSSLQPRRALDEDKLEELTESIREKGILNPIIVRKKDKNRYTIIAGERRWRAAKRAGISKIPIISKDADELEAFELALVENIQREDLSPFDEAQSYKHLILTGGYQHEEIAHRVGKDRSTVTNSLRLLNLPEEIQQLVGSKKISVGHARALLGMEDEKLMIETANDVVKNGYSVRALEQLLKKGKKRSKPKKPVYLKTPQIKNIEDRLRSSLGTKIVLKAKNDDKGSLTINYYSVDQLNKIISLLMESE